jgi:hypothetical protein
MLAFAMTFAVVAIAMPSASCAAGGAECDQRYPATCGERIAATSTRHRARRHTRHPRRLARHAARRALAIRAPFVDANGNLAGLVVSRKTGARAHVAPRYAEQFQAYVDNLERDGATVRFMGGIRRGRCWPGGLHPCGKALDVCQLSRARVDGRCHLPGRQQLAAIAARRGLFEGGQWCRSDYGHAQVGVSAAACGSSRVNSARRHHHPRRTPRR